MDEAGARFLWDMLGMVGGWTPYCHCVKCRGPVLVKELEAHRCGTGTRIIDVIRKVRREGLH